jgi:RimJ/RimL family protein N-acetyltransferase
MSVTLRPLVDEDADFVFDMLRDPVAVHMVGATSTADPDDRTWFDGWFAEFRFSPDVRSFAVLEAEELAGVVAVYNIPAAPEVTFWIDRGFWGRGIGSRSLALLLEEVPDRPLLAGTLVDNLGSLAVLRHNGFREIGRERILARGRGLEVESVRLRLD